MCGDEPMDLGTLSRGKPAGEKPGKIQHSRLLLEKHGEMKWSVERAVGDVGHRLACFVGAGFCSADLCRERGEAEASRMPPAVQLYARDDRSGRTQKNTITWAPIRTNPP